MKHINTFNVGDKVRTPKGCGTVISKDYSLGIKNPIITVELDNEHGIYEFYKWQICHKEATNDVCKYRKST